MGVGVACDELMVVECIESHSVAQAACAWKTPIRSDSPRAAGRRPLLAASSVGSRQNTQTADAPAQARPWPTSLPNRSHSAAERALDTATMEVSRAATASGRHCQPFESRPRTGSPLLHMGPYRVLPAAPILSTPSDSCGCSTERTKKTNAPSSRT
eukprot:CAMPEP_0173168932 /NCGR_PEP_ID=MMETSP1141-20130122/420_1 /TAXON_ID=483371 /ORGANISM="non described non described, Strain CCMP2298" /LENGTH=155 /DNA_ID=CAMNT_0014090697 /DNA_START=353 /DNA_END=821 /DNA_ORIENTATION=-